MGSHRLQQTAPDPIFFISFPFYASLFVGALWRAGSNTRFQLAIAELLIDLAMIARHFRDASSGCPVLFAPGSPWSSCANVSISDCHIHAAQGTWVYTSSVFHVEAERCLLLTRGVSMSVGHGHSFTGP